jgi:hypothetical protein
VPGQDIPPPTDVLTLLFAAWAAGTAVFGAATKLWREVGGGHFKVVWLVVCGLSLATGFGYRPAFAVAAAALVTFFAIYRDLHLVAGLLTAALACAVLALAGPPYAFAPAALLGTVTNAMLLGHWHLNQPKLGTRPIAGLVNLMWVALAAFLTATGLVIADATGVGITGAATGIAFATFSAILTAMVRHLVKTRSIMSATGILYLEVLVLFVAAFTGTLASLA